MTADFPDLTANAFWREVEALLPEDVSAKIVSEDGGYRLTVGELEVTGSTKRHLIARLRDFQGPPLPGDDGPTERADYPPTPVERISNLENVVRRLTEERDRLRDGKVALEVKAARVREELTRCRAEREQLRRDLDWHREHGWDEPE